MLGENGMKCFGGLRNVHVGLCFDCLYGETLRGVSTPFTFDCHSPISFVCLSRQLFFLFYHSNFSGLCH